MIIHSDWHNHSEASYDSKLPLADIVSAAKSIGFRKIGITDHCNDNGKSFVQDLHNSAAAVKAMQAEHPQLVLGVELTPIAKPEYDYIAKTGSMEGYLPPQTDKPHEIELAQTKEELLALGVRYGIGASHWRVDVPNGRALTPELDACIREWHRQQLWLAQDERVTILGHPWYHGRGLWYHDFDVIPRSMKLEVAAALKEHGKYAECNTHPFFSPYSTDRFRQQYAEFMREMFEMGIPITFGSDSHNAYLYSHTKMEECLASVGFVDGDIVEIAEQDLWG